MERNRGGVCPFAKADLMCEYFEKQMRWFILTAVSIGFPALLPAQAPPPEPNSQPAPYSGETVQDYNHRLQQLQKGLVSHATPSSGLDYRIGPEDLLEISVFEAQEFNCIARVSASGEISMPRLGAVHAAEMTPTEIESVLAELLRRTYMQDPHVSVFVKEMQSHPVSVFGAVKRPGVFQIRGAKTLLEILSMAEGLTNEAGDTALVMHHSAPAGPTPVSYTLQPVRNEAERAKDSVGSSPAVSPAGTGAEAGADEINLKSLFESNDPRFNVLVFPGDAVEVKRAGIIYVVGEVKKPGGFQVKSGEKITVLQALALAEGFTRTAAKAKARIIRDDERTGARVEIPIDLNKVLSGKLLDSALHPRDILFVPNSSGRSALYRGLEAALSVGTGVAVYRW